MRNSYLKAGDICCGLILAVSLSLTVPACSQREGAKPATDKSASQKSQPVAETKASSAPDTNIAEVTVAELKSALDNHEDLLLLDVRSQTEYDAVHVARVDLVIPHTEIVAQINKLPANKDQLIYVICRTGRRSGIATRALIAQGYTNVHNVKGGTNAWIQAGYPVVRSK